MFIHILFIHSFVGGHVGWFHLFAPVTTEVVNIGVQVSESLFSSLVCLDL
jgi:hypothetical protein